MFSQEQVCEVFRLCDVEKIKDNNNEAINRTFKKRALTF